jgi:VIT1/CCC1 family predicted Fe2+/Mn2+ transporter
LSAATAQQVATELAANDLLGAHLRDELGILDSLTARPISAAWTSAVSFALGAGLPLATAFAMPLNNLVYSVTAVSLLSLAALGAVGARVGGAKIGPAMFRVTFWGALAMAATAGIGRLVGTAV